MKTVSLITAILGVCAQLCGGFTNGRFIQAKCSSSDKGTCMKPFCVVKSLQREIQTYSAGCTTLNRTLNKVLVNFKLEYKNLGNYRQIINFAEVDICEKLRSNNLEDLVFKIMKDFVAQDVDQCPLSGSDFQLRNLTRKPLKLSLIPLPDGFYKSTVTFKDDLDDKIFQSILVIQRTGRSDGEMK